MDAQPLSPGDVSALAVARLLRRGERLGRALNSLDRKLLANPVSLRIEDYRNLRRRVLDTNLVAGLYSTPKNLEHEYIALPALAQPLSLKRNNSLAECFKPNARLLYRYWSTEYMTHVKEDEHCAKLIFINCTHRSPKIYYRLDIMLGAIADIRRLFIPSFIPELLTLTSRALDPGIHQSLQEFVGCRVELGATCDSIAISKNAWEFVLPSTAKILSDVGFPKLSESNPVDQPVPRWVAEIKSLISSSTHPQKLSLKYISDHFETSLKTLERRLALHGESFQRLIDQELVVRGKRLLENSEDTLEVIADKLGFANCASFSNSFHRCTGVRPGMFRAHTKFR